MKKSNKILLKTTAILSILIAVGFLVMGIFLVFNISGFKDIYLEIAKESTGANTSSQITFQFYMGIFDCIVAIALNIYCALLYFRLTKVEGVVVGGFRVLVYMGILQCLFVASIIPGILAIITALLIRKEENKIASRPRENTPQVSPLEMKIMALKQQKVRGEITEEEYRKTLNELIEDSAKEQMEK